MSRAAYSSYQAESPVAWGCSTQPGAEVRRGRQCLDHEKSIGKRNSPGNSRVVASPKNGPNSGGWAFGGIDVHSSNPIITLNNAADAKGVFPPNCIMESSSCPQLEPSSARRAERGGTWQASGIAHGEALGPQRFAPRAGHGTTPMLLKVVRSGTLQPSKLVNSSLHDE